MVLWPMKAQKSESESGKGAESDWMPWMGSSTHWPLQNKNK